MESFSAPAPRNTHPTLSPRMVIKEQRLGKKPHSVLTLSQAGEASTKDSWVLQVAQGSVAGGCGEVCSSFVGAVFQQHMRSVVLSYNF